MTRLTAQSVLRYWVDNDFHALSGDGVPKGIRTPVTAVKGQCPGPLDDGDSGSFFARYISSDNLLWTLRGKYLQVRR